MHSVPCVAGGPPCHAAAARRVAGQAGQPLAVVPGRGHPGDVLGAARRRAGRAALAPCISRRLLGGPLPGCACSHPTLCSGMYAPCAARLRLAQTRVTQAWSRAVPRGPACAGEATGWQQAQQAPVADETDVQLAGVTKLADRVRGVGRPGASSTQLVVSLPWDEAAACSPGRLLWHSLPRAQVGPAARPAAGHCPQLVGLPGEVPAAAAALLLELDLCELAAGA